MIDATDSNNWVEIYVIPTIPALIFIKGTLVNHTSVKKTKPHLLKNLVKKVGIFLIVIPLEYPTVSILVIFFLNHG
jgi:hypothetical protein